MKLGIVLNSSDPETAYNGLRLGDQALGTGNEATVFLLGSGVEITNVESETFDVAGTLQRFLDGGGGLLACGTCLDVRHQEAGICPVSTMAQLLELITASDKVVSLS
jgi:uncharacterized protein involved in oxidation of intracellular sulfur